MAGRARREALLWAAVTVVGLAVVAVDPRSLTSATARTRHRRDPAARAAARSPMIGVRQRRLAAGGVLAGTRRDHSPDDRRPLARLPGGSDRRWRAARVGHKGADRSAPEYARELCGGGRRGRRHDRARRPAPGSSSWTGRLATGGGGAGRRGRSPLLVAHDWGDARRREPLTLDEVLDAFTRPPLDGVEIDCDLKIAGREDEVVAAPGERGPDGASVVSTMEVSSLGCLRSWCRAALGWTVPR